MDLDRFFVEGFGSHDLADALQLLGLGDEVFEADATKSGLAQILVSQDKPLQEVLGAFYGLALSNACGTFGLPSGTKADNVARLAEFLEQQSESVRENA